MSSTTHKFIETHPLLALAYSFQTRAPIFLPLVDGVQTEKTKKKNHGLDDPNCLIRLLIILFLNIHLMAWALQDGDLTNIRVHMIGPSIFLSCEFNLLTILFLNIHLNGHDCNGQDHLTNLFSFPPNSSSSFFFLINNKRITMSGLACM